MLRVVAIVSTTVLFIPLVNAALQMFSCQSLILSALGGMTCFGAVHICILCGVMVVVLVYTAFAVIGTPA